MATKRSAGVVLEVNLREHVICKPLPSVNKAAHSGFEAQMRCHQKSKTGVSMAPKKGLMSSKKINKAVFTLDSWSTFINGPFDLSYIL